MDEIKVLVKKPNERCELRTIDNCLETFQGIVGGWIEIAGNLADVGHEDIICICNEEGKLKGLEPNLYLNGDFIVGTIILCGVDGDEFADFPFDPYDDPLWKFAMEERK